MKKNIFLIGVLLLTSALLSAQTPTYLTKAYQPVEKDLYNTYPSLEIQGGDVWNNCFTLGVINNYHGHAQYFIIDSDTDIGGILISVHDWKRLSHDDHVIRF